jgi:hypothetical protein
MHTLTGKTIDSLVSFIRENLSVYAGEGDNRRILIKPGLKITNTATGLQYTVDTVFTGENGLLIKCVRPPDVSITITTDDLKQFERT